VKKISIINGPKLNLLGSREPHIYGEQSFEDFLISLRADFSAVQIEYFQSDLEDEIIEALELHSKKSEAIILNPAIFTHTSERIAECIESIKVPIIEVHISHVFARESFRKESKVAPFCTGSITGLGLNGYKLALQHFLK